VENDLHWHLDNNFFEDDIEIADRTAYQIISLLNKMAYYMRDNYDFSDAIKNPFSGREKGKFTVKIHYDFTKSENNIDDAAKLEHNKESLSIDAVSKNS